MPIRTVTAQLTEPTSLERRLLTAISELVVAVGFTNSHDDAAALAHVRRELPQLKNLLRDGYRDAGWVAPRGDVCGPY